MAVREAEVVSSKGGFKVSDLVPQFREAKRRGRKKSAAIKNLELLDGYVSGGREPFDLEWDVIIASADLIEEFYLWMRSRALIMPEWFVVEYLRALFQFVYLEKWERRARFDRIPRDVIGEFIDRTDQDLFEEVSGGLSTYDLFLLFYRYLDEGGYSVKYSKILRTVDSFKLASELEHEQRCRALP